MTKIKERGTSVTISYKLLDENGNIIEDSEIEDKGGISFVTGTESVIKGVENSIIGRMKGETIEFTVEPKDGYGEYDPSMKVDVDLSNLPEGVKVGDELVGSNGVAQYQCVVSNIEDNVATLDQNHPLSGKTLRFKVEVLDTVDLSDEDFESLTNDPLKDLFNIGDIMDEMDDNLDNLDLDLLKSIEDSESTSE